MSKKEQCNETDAIQIHISEDRLEMQMKKQGSKKPFTKPKIVQSSSEIPWWAVLHLQAYARGTFVVSSSPQNKEDSQQEEE